MPDRSPPQTSAGRWPAAGQRSSAGLASAPKLSGAAAVRIGRGSLAHSIYQRDEVQEEYFCNYEVNPQYESRFTAGGLAIVARGPQGEVRAVELAKHRFFLATLFQPQLSSTAERSHPVVLAFLQAAARFQGRSAEDGVPRTEV